MSQVQPEKNTTGGPSPRHTAQGDSPNRKIAEEAGETGRSFADAASNAGCRSAPDLIAVPSELWREGFQAQPR